MKILPFILTLIVCMQSAVAQTKNVTPFSNAIDSYEISKTAPNRIAVRNARIINAVYDQTKLEIQTEEATGEIFVIPKDISESVLYLTTSDEETIAISLLPREIASQSITLVGSAKKGTKKTSSTPIVTLESNAFDATIKKLVMALARGESVAGFDEKYFQNIKLMPGKPRLFRRMTGLGLVAEAYRLKAKEKPSEGQFLGKGIQGVAIDQIQEGLFNIYLVGFGEVK